MKSLTLVLLGGTGDLSKKKLLPAIQRIIKRDVVDRIDVIATGRRDLTIQQYSEMMSFTPEDPQRIRLHYLQTDFEKSDALKGLWEKLKEAEDESCIGRLFYLAISPKYFRKTAKRISKCTFEDDKSEKEKFTRILIEKPFGHDLKSGRSLMKSLSSYFHEDQIFCVDHYLGKETVQNILILRFANPFFERNWNGKSIASIRIIVSEDFGVGNRISFYNETGALRDVVQNHMMQMLSFILMDTPQSTDPKDIHAVKADALKKLSPSGLILGQYEGYADEVKSSTDVETYAKVMLSSKSKRWRGTKIELITGKFLDSRFARIELQFKKEPCIIYCDIKTYPNSLILNVQPIEDIELLINTKTGNDIVHTKLKFSPSEEFLSNTPESYEVILEEAIKGNKTIFISNRELEFSWKIIDSIRTNLPKPSIYEKGSKYDAVK
jgi:glucose-6-phosphate 1-dehydrogenase